MQALCSVAQSGELKHTWVVFCSSLVIRALAICHGFLPEELGSLPQIFRDSLGIPCPSSHWCSNARCCTDMRRSSPAAESSSTNVACDVVPPKESKSFLNQNFMKTLANRQQIAASQEETSTYGPHGSRNKVFKSWWHLIKISCQREEQQLKTFSQCICPLMFAFDRLQFIQYLFSLFYFLPSSDGISSSWFHCSSLRHVQGYKLMPNGYCSPHLWWAFLSCFLPLLTGHSSLG